MTPANRSWLVGRAALALALMVTFYALALFVSLGLLWVAYADVSYARRPNGRLILFCLVGGGSVLWALVPRVDRFEKPGPPTTRGHEPQLFAVLEEVAAATSQPMPSDVYIVNDVNAFVTQRGGVMGFGSRRVMGIGLPLMQALTVQELRGVIAHEFGHYHSGDVGLGPWIYKTRAAIERTIHQLSNSILQKIFIWYGNLFLRITHAVSRRQEFIADEVAARVAGAGAMASGLRKVHAAAFAFQGYWHTEVGPLLASGYLPPVSQGFQRFMQSTHVASSMDTAVKQAETEGTTDPYDTHPSLRDRLAALTLLPHGSAGDTRPAVSLLANMGTWERRVLGTLVNDEWARSLKAIAWDSVADAVYVPIWRERVKRHAQLLKDMTPATIPFSRVELARLGGALCDKDEGPVPNEDRMGRMVQLLMCAIGLHLVGLGWKATTTPGEEIVLVRQGEELRLYSTISSLVDGKTTIDAWRAKCAELGIAALPLAAEVVAM